MAFPPPVQKQAAPPAAPPGASASESESESESASESSSNASPSKMKGAKPNPLRKWAAQMADGSTAAADDEDYE